MEGRTSSPLIARRPLMLGMAALAALGPGSRSAGARGAVPQPIRFRALRNGNPIGSHRLHFAKEGDRLTVDIEISFEVKILFLTVYSYHHSNRETWRSGRLVAIETRTDDDGDLFRVSGRAEGDRFEVDGSSGRLSLPADIAPTSYWDEAMATRGEWLDTQFGKIARSAVKAQPAEAVRVGRRTVRAKLYSLVGDITCDLWYHEGEWVKLLFKGEDGSIIEYARITPAT